MKKILTIGILAGGVAVIPMVGAFAAGTYTFSGSPLVTTLNLTINDACNFSRTSQTVTVEMNPNQLDTSMTSTYKIICNDAAGYSVSAVFTKMKPMTGYTGTNIDYSETTPTAGSGTWTATKGAASATTNIAGTYNTQTEKYTGGTLMSGTGPTSTSGTTQQVTYKVGTAAAQAAGNYQATATYTATQNT